VSSSYGDLGAGYRIDPVHVAVELDAEERTAGREQILFPEIILFADASPPARFRVRLKRLPGLPDSIV